MKTLRMRWQKKEDGKSIMKKIRKEYYKIRKNITKTIKISLMIII